MDPLTLAILGGSLISGGASIFGGLTQRSQANKALDFQKQMFAQTMAANQPFISAGQGAAGTLSGLLRPGGNMSDILQTIPGFRFLQDITQQGVANQATTTGLGGNTLLAGANAANQVAFGAGWQPIVNSLQGLVQSGVGAAGNLGTAATQTGAGGASSLIQGGNAIAGGAMGAANAIGGGLTTSLLLNRLLGQQQGGANYTGQGMYTGSQFPGYA